MKKLILLGLFVPTISFSQSKVNESRQTKGFHQFQEFDLTSRQKRAPGGVAITQGVDKKARFTIMDETTLPDSYIIYFWDWPKSAVATSKYLRLNYEAAGVTKRYFVILKSDLEIVSEKIYKYFAPTVGAMTFPFKYRPQRGKFEKTFSVGASGGVTWNPTRVNTHVFSLLGAVSASSATLDKYNTDPAANILEPTDRTAVSFSLSLIYQWQHLQIGISGGIDNILENEVVKWKYQGKGWLSFGIGVNLFTSNEIKNPGSN